MLTNAISSKWLGTNESFGLFYRLNLAISVYLQIFYVDSTSDTAKFYTAATMLNSSTSWRRIDLINKKLREHVRFYIGADTYKNTNHDIKRNGYTNLRNVIIRN